jgi:anti-sigma factor RsiW
MNDSRLLEERITEAIDGLLSDQQLSVLEADLQRYPELLNEYRMQMGGLPVRSSYANVQPDPFAVGRLRQKMRSATQDQWQYDAIRIFKRYVLASGLGVILFFVALHAIPGATNDTDMIDDEISIMFESLEQDALSWSVIDNSTPSQK